MTRLPTTFGPTVWCPHCEKPLPVDKEIDLAYFSGTKPLCSHCSGLVDWWDAILKAVSREHFLSHVLAPIGAHATLCEITMMPEKIVTLDFGDYGVPATARIVEINYTPQGTGLFPVELHGNTPQRFEVPRKVILYPKQFPNEPAKETRVCIMVSWIPNSGEDEAWRNLVEAFEAYSRGRFVACIIPANLAVEATLGRIMKNYLQQYASRERVDRFLIDAATYSHQLNVLLPLVAAHLGLPKLSDSIRGMLNKLRAARNDVAHQGVFPLTRAEAAEMLVAALFGFRYLFLLERALGVRGHGVSEGVMA